MVEKEEISKELGNLKADMAELKEHLAALAKAVKDEAKSEGTDYKARFEAQAREVLDKMKGLVEDARNQGRRAYQTVENQVQERPMVSLATSMGIGVAVGVLVGRLLGRR